ncbi:MAG: hypothetical protein RL375_633, partial [Pseudomonadota bacterium]
MPVIVVANPKPDAGLPHIQSWALGPPGPAHG